MVCFSQRVNSDLPVDRPTINLAGTVLIYFVFWEHSTTKYDVSPQNNPPENFVVPVPANFNQQSVHHQPSQKQSSQNMGLPIEVN